VIDHPIKPILQTLPTLPGCYLYKDVAGTILYVGKAKNLRKRVTSYFFNYHKLTARIQLMIDNAIDVEFHTVDSEVEALILEASLIKKYKPKYNVLLKDDKAYSWIKITWDPYPIIYRTRNLNDKRASYFGPFTSAIARDQIYNFLRKEFPFRSCSYTIDDEELAERAHKRKAGQRVRSRLCTFYHIGRCGGPCEGLVGIDEYAENIENIKKFLKNKKRVLIKDLEGKMRYYAGNMEYERAGKVKQQIDSLNYVAHRSVVGHGDDEDDVMRLELQRAQKGLEVLIKRLKLYDLKSMTKEERADFLDNFRIECFDISNIQGTNPVGAMVVCEGGIMLKAHYRKFKINVKETPDDFAMMREMLTRRLRYLSPKLVHQRQIRKEALWRKSTKFQTPKPEAYPNLEENSNEEQSELTIEDSTLKIDLDPSFSSKPHLIIIDGGKGQLKQGIDVLHDMKIIDIPVSGLAKRREEIYRPNEKDSYLFDDKKEALFLLQRIRDEAHRFGITYHRHRRSKAMLQ
jgi:excinuclease ABC subunit C